MAQVNNSSDQLRISFELSRAPEGHADWFPGVIREERFSKRENRYYPIIDGSFEIYTDDLSRLRKELVAFLTASDDSKNIKFVPVAEPSFELSLERIPHGHDYCQVVSVAVDLKMFAPMEMPIAYGENRVSTRIHTTNDKIEKFVQALLMEIDRAMGNNGG